MNDIHFYITTKFKLIFLFFLFFPHMVYNHVLHKEEKINSDKNKLTNKLNLPNTNGGVDLDTACINDSCLDGRPPKWRFCFGELKLLSVLFQDTSGVDCTTPTE